VAVGTNRCASARDWYLGTKKAAIAAINATTITAAPMDSHGMCRSRTTDLLVLLRLRLLAALSAFADFAALFELGRSLLPLGIGG